MIELTTEYRALALKFKKQFGYGVPLAQIPDSVTTEELIIVIQESIDSCVDLLPQKFNIDNSGKKIY